MFSNEEIKARVTDFHTHILPGMDDGAKDTETSLAMLRKLYQGGVRKIVLTPHFYPWNESPEEFRVRRAKALNELTNAVGSDSGIRMTLGAEVAYFRGIGRSESVRTLTVGESDLILVELPYEKWDKTILEDLTMLMEYGRRIPVIAHLDRYPSADRRMLHVFRERGFLIQCNAEHFMQKHPPMRLLQMLDAGEIDFLGSDCHNIQSRPPVLGDVLDRIIGYGYGSALERLSDRTDFLLKN